MSKILPALCREKGYSQTRLERETGIGHSTMQRYWSGDGGLGLKNGRKIAAVLDVELSRLELTEEEEVVSDLEELRYAQAALEETVRTLTAKVEALERRREAPRRGASARKRKAV